MQLVSNLNFSVPPQKWKDECHVSTNFVPDCGFKAFTVGNYYHTCLTPTAFWLHIPLKFQKKGPPHLSQTSLCDHSGVYQELNNKCQNGTRNPHWHPSFVTNWFDTWILNDSNSNKSTCKPKWAIFITFNKNKINLLTNPNTWTQTWIKFRSDGACNSKLRKFAPSILY